MSRGGSGEFFCQDFFMWIKLFHKTNYLSNVLLLILLIVRLVCVLEAGLVLVRV